MTAGYQTSRMRVESRQAHTMNDALKFVNNLIRHDLRNDLNVIHGHANLIDSGLTNAERDSTISRSSLRRLMRRLLVSKPLIRS